MATREVLRFPALKAVARPLAPDEPGEAARVAADLLDTMRSFGHCVGLAAPQLGELVRLRSEGFEARRLLHEIDHLDGILFLDRVDSLATDVFRGKR